MATKSIAGASAPRWLSHVLDDYRHRLGELGDTEVSAGVLRQLVAASPERAAYWLFAGATLHHGPVLIRDDEFCDVAPVVDAVRTRAFLNGGVDAGVEFFMATLAWGWAQAAFEHQGRRVYEVSRRLADSLANTELRGLGVDQVQLPTRALYVSIPPESGLRLPDGRPLVGAYLVECISNTREREGARFLVAHAHGPVDPAAGIRDLLMGALTVRLELVPGRLLVECLAERRSSSGGDHGYQSQMVPLICRWLLNVVLYATMPGARLEPREANPERASLLARIAKLPSGKKRKHLQQRLKGEPSDLRICLGEPGPGTGRVSAATVGREVES